MSAIASSKRRPFAAALSLLKDISGNSAVEFALVAPLLAAMLLGIADVGKIGYERTDMFAAARSGAQYFMAGGSDFERASYVVHSSWTEEPEDAIVTIDRFCQCQAVEASCSVPCPDGNVPDAFARIRISATVEGIFLKYENIATDTVRIR